MHKRQIGYLILYSVLIACTAVFVTLSFLFGKAYLADITSVFIIAWFPVVAFTVFSALPQTIAGNVFFYQKIKDMEKRRERIALYSSGEYLETEMFETVLNRKAYSKPLRITRAKGAAREPGIKKYDVQLRDMTKYRVCVVKRDPERDLHYTTRWVVNEVELLKK